jgi:hypothetical protein
MGGGGRATRSEGDDLEESAPRALMRYRGEEVVWEAEGVDGRVVIFACGEGAELMGQKG